jgi:hypothetical protein
VSGLLPETQDAASSDELLDEVAQGENVTSDESPVGTGEIDEIGHAAGLVVRDDKPFRGIDEVERRDEHRWELDPASAEDDPATR